MRLGVVVELARTPLSEVAGLAVAVERAALELVWLRSTPERPYDALVAAASCAHAAPSLHVGAQVPIGTAHPLYLAEERAVVDQLLGGRLVLALHGGGDVEELGEWTELLLKAGGTAPFTHAGTRFRVPAGLPGNVVNTEDAVRVTPAPFGLEPALWLDGDGSAEIAAEYGLSVLTGEEESGAEAWADLDARLGRAALRLRRPGLRAWDPTAEDATELARRLARERDDWGLDTALLRLAPDPGTDDWRRRVAELAHVVRPRVQLHRLPDGLEDFWDRERIHLPTAGDDHSTTATERR